MTTVFRIVRLIALAIWVGGLVFFGFVAAVAFSTLPDTHSAGLVVRGSLIALHHIGLVAGIAYLLLTRRYWLRSVTRIRCAGQSWCW